MADVTQQPVNVVPQHVTSCMTYLIVRAVIATIGQSSDLPQDQISILVKNMIREKTNVRVARG